MIYQTRRERIEAEKAQRRGRHMRSMKVGMASFATFAGVTVAGIAPAHADHTVERGDTLSKIAAQYDNVTVSGLMQANGLSSHLIYPGQNLSFSNTSSSSDSASTSSSSSASSSGTHTVVSGDTLSRIASQHGTTVSALMSENGLNSHLIYPGDRLTIPGGSSSSGSSPSASSTPSNSGSSSSSSSSTTSSGGSHTVVSGDTLGRIASQHGTSVSALMSANGLSSTLIYPGTQLSIPGSSGSSSSASSTPSNSGSSSSSSSSSNSSSSSSSSSSNVTTASSSATQTSSTSTSGVSWAVSTANSSSASYRLGANGEGNQWDCSSFSQHALSQDGKSLPRTAAAQYASAQKISHGQLQAGDLVFYGNGRVTHVAVYVGNDQIAHARNPSAGLSVDSLSTYSQYNNVIGYGRY